MAGSPETVHFLQLPVVRQCFRCLLNGCAGVTVLAPTFKTTLEQSGIRNVHLARTMFDGTLFPQHPPIAKTSRRTILFLSRLVRQKGVYELLQAFTALAADFPDVDLVVAGDGKEHKALQALIAASGVDSRIHLTGHVTGNDKIALLQSCSIFALPTYYPEGLPVVLLEAMAAGKPLLTASAGGIGHAIHEPQNGIVLKTVTITAIENALRTLLSNTAYCAATGNYNARIAWEEFEGAKVSAQIETLYRAIG